VALVARRKKDLDVISNEIRASGGEVWTHIVQELLRTNDPQAHSFPLKEYTREEITAVFKAVRKQWPDSRIKVSLWNASQWSKIPFLEVTEQVSRPPSVLMAGFDEK
jgi:hypothetical protein